MTDLGELPDTRIHGKDPAACPGVDGSYPLVCHLLDTALVIEQLWHSRVRSGLKERITTLLAAAGFTATPVQLLMLAAALHDIGKINPWFQYQERENHDYASILATATARPRSPFRVAQKLRANPQHPLRRHEFISHRAVLGDWPDNHDAVRGPTWFGMLVAGHHGYWRAAEFDGPVDRQGEQLIDGWTAQQAAHLRLVEETLGVRVSSLQALPDSPEASIVFVCFSGLLTLADWLASDDTIVAGGKELWERTGLNDVLDEAFARSWLTSRSVELTEHLTTSLGDVKTGSRAEVNEAILAGHTPRPLQAEALQFSRAEEPGLWVCMYPTGDGKTEAALLRGAADPAEGLIFGLPTMATTDAMESRLLAMADRLPSDAFSLLKAHQFAGLLSSRQRPEDQDCDDMSDAWFSSSIRKIVAHNMVGTVDQVLAGSLAQRHINFRLFGLANHHVVLDEVHTFDAYQTELLLELLYWWGLTDTRVTLLSATLPTRHVQMMARAYQAGVRGERPSEGEVNEPISFPSTLSVSRTGAVSTQRPNQAVRTPPATSFDVVQVSHRVERVEHHVAWAKQTTTEHPHSPVAIVVNVVDDAIAVAQRLLTDEQVRNTHEVVCLHSRMVLAHRLAVEEHLQRRAGRSAHLAGFDGVKPLLIVGTQVIQASLDFDVDFLSSDLAPAPDLIQRLGRSWRFEGSIADAPFRGGRLPVGTDRRVRVVAIADDQGNLSDAGAAPYLVAPLRRTLGYLLEHPSSARPLDLMEHSQPWVDHAYNQAPEDLLLEATANSAVAEAVAIQNRLDSADQAKAALATATQRTNAVPLLAPGLPGSPGPRWQHLVALTTRHDDPDLMRTRFIEQDPIRVWLFDSAAMSTWFDPRTGEARPFPSYPADQKQAKFHLNYISSLVSLSGRVQTDAQQPIAETRATVQWDPPRSLARVNPLNLDHFAGWHYHPMTGLTNGA